MHTEPTLLEMIGESSDQELNEIIEHINSHIMQDPNTDHILRAVLQELIKDIQEELVQRTTIY